MRVEISLSAILTHIVPKHGEVNVFVPPEKHGLFFHPEPKNNIGIIVNKDDKKVLEFLNGLKVTGWDWQPEKLTHNKFGDFVVYTSSLHQYPEEVEAAIKQNDIKVNNIKLTLEEFQSLVNAGGKKTETVTESGDLYGRTRFLWQEHNKKFSDWERSFVKNVGGMLKNQKKLVGDQPKHLDRLFEKYKVPLEATASEGEF